MRLIPPHIRDDGAAYVTAAIVVGLIVADLLASRHADVGAKALGEVQNYALFTTVTERGVSIVTGTEFASTGDRRIVHQWCYLTRDAADGTITPQVTLATATPTGRVTRASITQETLSAFGLNAATVTAFVDGYCRFQREG